MLIGQIYFKGDVIALRDVDGSEVELTFDDAISLFIWLRHHMDELEQRNLALHQRTNNPDEYLHTSNPETGHWVTDANRHWSWVEKPETSYLDDPTRVEPGWLGDTYDEGQKIAEYNRQMDERNRIAYENRDKPWLPLHDGE